MKSHTFIQTVILIRRVMIFEFVSLDVLIEDARQFNWSLRLIKLVDILENSLSKSMMSIWKIHFSSQVNWIRMREEYNSKKEEYIMDYPDLVSIIRDKK